MADEAQILALREMVNEDDDCGGWDDEKLSAIIDSTETLNSAAAQVWRLKAGQYASLVDVSESGSSRKLGDLRKNAAEMSAMYAAEDGDSSLASDGPIVQRIRRTVA